MFAWPGSCWKHRSKYKNNSKYTLINGVPSIVTAGADRTIQIIPITNQTDRTEITDHTDFIYSLKCVNDLIFSGSGDGLLYVHDINEGKLLYALGANKGAVRCIEATNNKLIAAGDDGKVLIYNY